MTGSLIQEALKKHKLENYYPKITSYGITRISSLADMTINDCSKFGIHSREEKIRFASLTQELKATIGNNNKHQEAIPTKRRIMNTKIDARSRRMTLAPQSLIPKTPPSNIISVRDRRLSYLPRRETMFQRLTVPKQASPPRSKTMARPAFLDELNISKKKEPVEKPTRLLDTYGIPITQKQQQKNLASSSSEVKSKANHKSYDLPNSDLHQRIRVCVRKRPLSRKEKIAKESDIADVVGNRTLHINAPRTKIDLTRVTEQYPFIFDEVFDSGVTNEQIYKRTAQPLVEYMFNGGKATCFAHGQTGSGKTYTMLDPNHGLYFRAAQDVFRLLSQHRYSHLNVYVAFYEIYQNQIYDLLNDRNRLLARSDANNDVTITGLKYYRVKVVDNLIKIFEVGNEARMTGQTGANTNSSRSHAILQILLKDKEQVDYGKLSFIDLAGSERGADRGESDAKTRMEGAEINKSLLALKECIRALDQEQRHTPFRGSKLTQVLRDSFIGDSRTCMIATISPNFANSDHTLNTLRYADRMKQLRSETRLPSSSDIELERQQQLQQQTTTFDDEDLSMSDTKSEDNNKNNHNKNNNNMSNLEHMFDEEPENLLDVSFPDIIDNALSTPTSNRIWDEKTSELRRMNYINRIESPPPEAFGEKFLPNILESISRSNNTTSSSGLATEWFSVPSNEPVKDRAAEKEKAVIMMDSDKTIDGQPMKRKAIDNDDDSSVSPLKRHKSGMNIEQMRQFIKLHRAQIKELEECIRDERKLVTTFSLTISSNNDFNDDNETVEVDEKSKELFEEYLNDLNELLNRKLSCIEVMQEKVKKELNSK